MSFDDRVDESVEFHREIAMRQRKPEGPPAVGYCHNCHEPLQPGARFCDSDCRDDWENRNARGC